MNFKSLLNADVSVGCVELSLMRLSVRRWARSEAQWGGPTCSIQVRTSLEEAHRVVERQGHESEVPFDEVASIRKNLLC